MSSADVASLLRLMNTVGEHASRNNWIYSHPVDRLKHMSGEVVELMDAVSRHMQSCGDTHYRKDAIKEALHVIWNALAFLNEWEAEEGDVESALIELLHRASVPKNPPFGSTKREGGLIYIFGPEGWKPFASDSPPFRRGG